MSHEDSALSHEEKKRIDPASLFRVRFETVEARIAAQEEAIASITFLGYGNPGDVVYGVGRSLVIRNDRLTSTCPENWPVEWRIPLPVWLLLVEQVQEAPGVSEGPVQLPARESERP